MQKYPYKISNKFSLISTLGSNYSVFLAKSRWLHSISNHFLMMLILCQRWHCVNPLSPSVDISLTLGIPLPPAPCGCWRSSSRPRQTWLLFWYSTGKGLIAMMSCVTGPAVQGGKGRAGSWAVHTIGCRWRLLTWKDRSQIYQVHSIISIAERH